MKNIFLGKRNKNGKINIIFVNEIEGNLKSYSNGKIVNSLFALGDCFKLTKDLKTSIFFYRDKDKINNKDTYQYDNDDYRKVCMPIEYNNSFKNLKKMFSSYNFFMFEDGEWVRYGNKSG